MVAACWKSPIRCSRNVDRNPLVTGRGYNQMGRNCWRVSSGLATALGALPAGERG